jgi:type I restriction enzyme, S subunit
MPWIDCKLGDVLTLKRGYDLPHRERREGSIPIVSSSGVSGSHEEAKVSAPGVVTGRYGTLGGVFYLEQPFWPLNTTLYVQDFKDNHPRFVAYFLQTLGLASLSAAAAVPGLNRNHLHLLPVRIPPPQIQRKIASVLSAYDDLIENNNRRIKILEEMAQNLYREWFVKFRFPGHENNRMVDSPLGEIPEGWEVVSLKAASVNFDRKRVPLSSMQREEIQGTFPYYGAAKVLDHVNDYIFDGRYLLVAEDGSVITPDGYPVLQIATKKFWVNNHAHVLQGEAPFSVDYLYLTLSRVAIAGYMTGAAQPKITQANLNRIPVLKPSSGLLEAFGSMSGPLFRLTDTLHERNSVLCQTRDLLLPRLISGEVDVSEVETVTEDG